MVAAIACNKRVLHNGRRHYAHACFPLGDDTLDATPDDLRAHECQGNYLGCKGGQVIDNK